MKKIIAVIALTAVLLSAAGCTSGNGNVSSGTTAAGTSQSTTTAAPEADKNMTSADYTEILVGVRDPEDPNPITGRNEDGELVRTHDTNSYELTEEDKAYFTFEAILRHLEETGGFTIDFEERYTIAENAIKDAEGKSDAELMQMQNDAVIAHYSEKAGVTLTDADIAKISDAAIEAETAAIAESLKEQMRMELEVAGLTDADLGEFAFSTSLMMTRAYGIGIFMPADGKTDAVKAACEGFVELQKSAFETYLVDQYEIAKQAVVEVLDSGEVVLVMCENASDVFEQIKTAIEG